MKLLCSFSEFLASFLFLKLQSDAAEKRKLTAELGNTLDKTTTTTELKLCNDSEFSGDICLLDPREYS